MESKSYTQPSTFIVIVMSALLVLFVSLFINHGFSPDSETYLYAFLILIFLVCLLLFHKLTIMADRTTVSFKLGIGFGRSYKTADIISCKAVKNLWIYGMGIHQIPNGWLYNVSGLKAIELRFKDSSRVIRLGTNRPDEIAGMITELIGAGNKPEDNIPVSR